MKYDVIPAEAWKRQAIYVLDECQFDNAMMSANADELCDNEDICVLEYPVRGDSEISQTLREKGNLKKGAVLIQSPYEKNRYVKFEDAAEQLALDKFMYFSHFCQILGASQVKVLIAQRVSKKHKFEARLEGDMLMPTGKGKGKVDLDMQKFQETISQMSFHDEFAGGAPDVRSAEILLANKGLQGDANINSLLLARRHEGNKMLSRKLDINLNEEVQNTLQTVISFNMLLPTTALSLKSSFARDVEELYEYRLTVEVKFE